MVAAAQERGSMVQRDNWQETGSSKAILLEEEESSQQDKTEKVILFKDVHSSEVDESERVNKKKVKQETAPTQQTHLFQMGNEHSI